MLKKRATTAATTTGNHTPSLASRSDRITQKRATTSTTFLPRALTKLEPSAIPAIGTEMAARTSGVTLMAKDTTRTRPTLSSVSGSLHGPNASMRQHRFSAHTSMRTAMSLATGINGLVAKTRGMIAERCRIAFAAFRSPTSQRIIARMNACLQGSVALSSLGLRL